MSTSAPAVPTTLVLIPTYNERENLPGLVRAVIGHPGFRVMVVDDRSPDGTGEVADALAREFPDRVEVLHRTGKKGLGRSYIEALLLARARSEDFVCQMDADLSHDPKYLPEMVAMALRDGHDLIIGSRYLHGVSVVNWPLHRLILSTFANRYIRAVTRMPVADCTSGFRCWRRQALAQVPLERIVSDGYAFLVEMTQCHWLDAAMEQGSDLRRFRCRDESRVLEAKLKLKQKESGRVRADKRWGPRSEKTKKPL